MQKEPPIDWTKHTKLAWRCVNELVDLKPRVLDFTTRDALHHEFCKVLIGCAQRFDPSLGVKFSSYAMPSMRRAFNVIISNAQGLRRNDRQRAALTDRRDIDRHEPVTPIDSMLIDERDSKVRESIRSLSEWERDYVRCVLINGESGASFGRRRGITKSGVSLRKKTIIKRLRESLAEHGITAKNQLEAA